MERGWAGIDDSGLGMPAEFASARKILLSER
jgi:hypothetical protein